MTKYIDTEEITPIMAEYVADVFSRKEHLDDISYGYCMEIAETFRRYAERAKQEQLEMEQEEKKLPEGLEEAAKKASKTWRRNEDGSESKELFPQAFVRGFIAGAEWGAEHLVGVRKMIDPEKKKGRTDCSSQGEVPNDSLATQSYENIPNDLEEAAMKAYPKRKDGRVRGYTCTDDDIRKVYAQGYRKAEKDLGWHSLDESLPEIDEEVIVLTDELNTAPIYKIALGHLVDTERYIDYNGWNIPGVKFWMPMPKIPKE